jgi:hypothetical protein
VESRDLLWAHRSMNESMLIMIHVFREMKARADDTEQHHRSGMVMISCRYVHDMIGKPVRKTTLQGRGSERRMSPCSSFTGMFSQRAMGKIDKMPGPS